MSGQPVCSESLPELPLLLAGPVLRRVEASRMVLWLATSAPVRLRLRLDGRVVALPECPSLQAGGRLFHHLIDAELPEPLVPGAWTPYTLEVADADAPGGWRDLLATEPGLCHAGQTRPGFRWEPNVASLLHGSCRKPHHGSGDEGGAGDGLAEADRLLQRLMAGESTTAWPSALVLTGDQIYADDVAGPMLRAIHQLARRLELPDEVLPGVVADGPASAQALVDHPMGYYRREHLLPRQAVKSGLRDILFGGVAKPVFTTDSAHNHLISLSEVLCMYLLVWSPVPWQGLDLTPPPGLSPRERERYDREAAALDAFVQGLPAVRRAMAHLPVAMIFDDHDITDDWNLSAEWENLAYGHPFSRRVIGNALLGYLLHQGWGNRPEVFGDACRHLAAALAQPGSDEHDAAVTHLLHFHQWHYVWPTEPALVVLDSRTHRWRSDLSSRQPSGLLDWESLTDLQQTLLDRQAVLLVSSAPIFGVKLIETIQHLFSWAGSPLVVDAENWMGHPGAASAILNIFRHPRTPQHFVVLSGDVHYSFVYDVKLRRRTRLRTGARSPDIWQICSSGLRNTFPSGLLAVLDHGNRWLYSPRSPLNWFTRRRHLRVVPRKPEGLPNGRRLLDASGVGLVELDGQGRPWRIRSLLADGRDVSYVPREAEARWD
ncbi:alkaline phosphatase D family protein [uncultured Hydrogenophaga sp.]|uniref:alkaline phosphatase D family protein n=1 Tax=uncultured Hydrogenophaga sp. TaxID=199683 RepID=UPI00265E9CD8|nr:alkaline phosphatase D family protein [uncultured Hydrogenophaga sp.]